MWHEIHFNKIFQCWALYVGTSDGYRIDKFYSTKITARISAVVHGYKFCMT